MLLIILLSCSPLPFFIYQLKNIVKYNPESYIVVNRINVDDKLKQEVEYISPSIFFTSQYISVRPHNGYGFHKAWFTCFNSSKHLEFTHVVLMASNELYFKTGAKEYIESCNIVEYKHENENIISSKNIYYTNGIRNKAFSKILSEYKLPFCIAGQWEGSYFPKQIFEKIVDKYYNIMYEFDIGQSCEETMLPSLVKEYLPHRLFPVNNHITKVFYTEPVECSIEHFSNIEDNIFSIKRVSYDTISSKVIKYINDSDK